MRNIQKNFPCVILMIVLSIVAVVIHFQQPYRHIDHKLFLERTKAQVIERKQKEDKFYSNGIPQTQYKDDRSQNESKWKDIVDRKKSFGEERQAIKVQDTNMQRKRIIMILTYMRSGSSFTGDLLQQDPEVFYLFEPFITLKRKIQKHSKYEFLNGTDKESRKFFKSVDSTIRYLSMCQLEKVDLSLWIAFPFLALSQKTSEYRQCYNGSKAYSRELIKRCLPYMISACERSKVILIKTIRLPMSLMEPLMRDFTDMQIVHLLRDPRATLWSMARYSNTDANDKHFISSFCERMHNDIGVARMFKVNFPGRIVRTVYEKLAANTIVAAKYLYKYLNLTFAGKTESYIHTLTSNDSNSCIVLCTVSKDSAKQTETWRSTISFSWVEAIQNTCGYLLDELVLNLIPSRILLRQINKYPLKTIDDEM